MNRINTIWFYENIIEDNLKQHFSSTGLLESTQMYQTGIAQMIQQAQVVSVFVWSPDIERQHLVLSTMEATLITQDIEIKYSSHFLWLFDFQDDVHIENLITTPEWDIHQTDFISFM